MNIINFPQKEHVTDLNTLLRRAVVLRGAKPDINNIKTVFGSKIMSILLDGKKISSEHFLCGLYVADLLAHTYMTPPQSWLAVDFIQLSSEEKDAQKKGSILKDGANACFLICSVFKGRGNFRLMDLKYYEERGMGLFYSLYSEAKKEIGLYMCRHYQQMAEITEKTLKTI